jgi:small subunit ribosomal protein S3Ae
MAVGKNKRLQKGGRRGGAKKKAGDPFLRKEWYDVKAPGMFQVRNCGKTLISRSQGQRIASEELKGRVFELNLADLNDDEDVAFKKIKLCIEYVNGKQCLTDFHGLSFTRDKLCSLIKKWQTLIEAHVDVRTTDDYVVRMFAIAFTERQNKDKADQQKKSNCYAQTAQIRKIRAKMVDTMTKEASKGPLRDLVKNLIPEAIGRNIIKQCAGIFPLKDAFVRKVKILKKPKFDPTRLQELHKDTGDDTGAGIGQVSEDAKNTLTASIQAQQEEADA